MGAIGDAMRISVPSDDGQIVGMRDLLSEKEITEVLDWLQETAPERPKRETWAHRMKSLTMQLQSGKLSERVSVIRYILQASGISPKSLAERNMLRSEEHTSELQSRGHLVCRLLLEKKKKHNNR